MRPFHIFKYVRTLIIQKIETNFQYYTTAVAYSCSSECIRCFIEKMVVFEKRKSRDLLQQFESLQILQDEDDGHWDLGSTEQITEENHSETLQNACRHQSIFLPDEILIEIFSYLSPLPYYISLRRLSREWRWYFEDELRKQKVFELFHPQYIDMNRLSIRNLSNVMQLFSNVEVVQVYNLNSVEDSSLFLLLKKHFSKLQSIEFYFCVFKGCEWVLIPTLQKVKFFNVLGEKTIKGISYQASDKCTIQSYHLNQLSFNHCHGHMGEN